MSKEQEKLEEQQISFLSHLRLVHFSLAAASLTLLVAASIAPRYIIESAYQQADQIRVTASDVLRWAQDNAPPGISGQLHQVYEAKPFHISDGVRSYALPRAFGRVSISELRMADPESYSESDNARDLDEPGIPFDSLADFRSLWDRLHRWSRAYTIAGWRPEEARFELDPALKQGAKTVVGVPSHNVLETIKLNDKNIFLHQRNGVLWEIVIEFEQNIDGDELRYQPNNNKIMPKFKSMRQPIQTLRVPVKLVRPQTNYQALLIEDLGVTWSAGKFAESFSDLSKLAIEIDSLRLPQLANHLQQLASEVGPPVKLFGASVPVKSVRTWGPIILVAIQIYFFLHFRRYHRHFAESRNAVRFAWLGAYNDKMSRIAFAISITLLPLLAIFLISDSQGTDASSGLRRDLNTWLSLTSSLGVALATLRYAEPFVVWARKPL